jgi:signal transduction histidine kinase
MTRSPSESPGSARLAWAGAFLLTAGLTAAAVASTAIAGRWGVAAAAAVAGVVALALLLILLWLAVSYRRASAEAAGRAAGTQELTGQLARQAAELEQRTRECQQLRARAERREAELAQLEDHRRAEHAAWSAALDRAVDQLIRVQLPLAFTGSAVPAPLPDDAGGPDGQLAGLFGHVLAAVTSGAAQLHEQLDEQRESARLAVVALARRVQASAHRIQEEATLMARRHPASPDVLESSMRVDHAAAQQARHAQSMAVLSGEWPGQQWTEPVALVDVARAAASRIVAYQRVAVSGDPEVAAAARVAEPLIHLVAEMLANATQSSPPASQVLVTVRSVQRGGVIEIDDGGVGMDEHRLEQARELASGRRPAGLTSLGEIPQTGLAVVGQYARRHGFGVDLVPSPYGGIRAVTLVPADLVEVVDPAGAPRQAAAPAGQRATRPEPGRPAGHAPQPRQELGPGQESGPRQEPSLAAGLDGEPRPAVTGAALPQRRSRRGEGGAHTRPAVTAEPAPAEPAPAVPPPSPAEAGAWLGAFLGSSTPASTGPADGEDSGGRRRGQRQTD